MKRDKKHVSPLLGAVFDYSGMLEKLYDISPYFPSATTKLVRALFHKQGVQFHATHLKSNAAYSLTPSLLANILYHVSTGTLDEARNHITSLWIKEHKLATGSTTSSKKINHYFDMILASQQECFEEKYSKNITVVVLLSFVYHISRTRQDILSYLSTFDSLTPIFDSNKSFEKNDLYTKEEINQFKDEIKEITSFSSEIRNLGKFIDQNHEKLLCTLMLNNALQPVKMEYYGYQNAKPVPNCAEIVFHDICNILFFNRDTQSFDFSLLPRGLKPKKELQAFYEMQELNPTKVNKPEVGQAFMDLISGQPELIYCLKNYELEPIVENFIPVMNNFFNCNAKSFKDLSCLFSDERRKVTFERNGKVVNIIFEYANSQMSYLNCNFDGNHAQWESNYFEEKTEKIFFRSLVMLSSALTHGFLENKNVLIFLFLKKKVNAEMLKNVLTTYQSLNNYHFYAMPETATEAFLLIRKLKLEQNYKDIEKFLLFVLDKFKSNLELLIEEVIETIVITGLDKQDKIFREIGLKYIFKYIDYKFPEDIPEKFSKDEQEILAVLKNKNDIEEADFIEALKKDKTSRIACFILTEKLDPNRTFKDGLTPLHKATSPKMVSLLLKMGANPNAADSEGRTLLHHYLGSMHLPDYKEMAKILLAGGADPEKQDKRGISAKDIFPTLFEPTLSPLSKHFK